ncbi:hypothetical protein HanXRQr2_Chr03g0120691 [Helianthus annuus]|uniref:Uncharacterized protein n=1 Tax=Helianthus annuus TaxID=4232 RepID=A0A9K3NWN1_HELAN|nr:hypothetical protein HanXRQr2_Chr03g0120691 [Helianthus annuus]KAJ0608749.1 hypothetical protein HanHA89_Chr03g0112481 [Helianthus annuus]KAJ0774537.1 hypothetical protein HanOQP8_Chr03g0113211 [Helianthus annuus]KAJ0944475.1 hypothetical protein HanPSC8_Chr03g0117201 [Helianthus annuus]
MVHEGSSLDLSHLKPKVFANMMRLRGTGVDAPLFGHMIVQDEEPLFPHSPAIETDPAVDAPLFGHTFGVVLFERVSF